PGGRTPPAGSPVRMPEICVAMVDDYLVIADSRSMMRQIADCRDGATRPLREALEFQLIIDRLTAQLQARECSGVAFSPPAELPPFAVVAKYLAPSGGFLVDEETGLHYMTFTLSRD